MKITILKRALCASVLLGMSFCASAQDVWINLFQNNGGVYTINADRVASVDFLEVQSPPQVGVKTYTGNRVDFAGDHFYTYYPEYNTVIGNIEGNELTACTKYGDKVYQFYNNGKVLINDFYNVGVVGDIITVPDLAGFTVFNAGVGVMGGTPYIFTFGRTSDKKNMVKVFDIETFTLQNSYQITSLSTSSKNVAAFNSATFELYGTYLDTKNSRYVIKKYQMSEDATPTTKYLPLDLANGVYGDVIDASYYKNRIFFLVGSADQEARFVVYNVDYGNVEAVLRLGTTKKAVGFIVDNAKSRFVVLTKNGENNDYVYLNELYLNRTKEITDNNAPLTMYTRLTMKNGEMFQTRVRYLSRFTATQGELQVESNMGVYSGQRIDLKESNNYYMYLTPGLLIDNFEDARGSEYYGGHIYTFFNKGTKEHALVGMYHGYEGGLKRQLTLSCLDDFEILTASFLENMTTYVRRKGDGSYEVVSVDIPLVAVTGYNSSGACESRVISIENDEIFATYAWAKHNKTNTPSFIAAWDVSTSRLWFVGECTVAGSENVYKVLSLKVSGTTMTTTRSEFTLPWDHARGLFGSLKDCCFANGMIYSLMEGDGTDENPAKIFVADPNIWKVVHILPLSSAPNYVDGGATTMPAVDGVPRTMALDVKNQRFVIGTQDNNNKGKVWVVTFD